MKIYFQDSNVDEEAYFSIDVETVPRVGETIHFGIDVLPDFFLDELNLREGDMPAVKVFTWPVGETIRAKVEYVTHLLLSSGRAVIVEVDVFADGEDFAEVDDPA